jgi:hypothetical protein
MLLSLLKKGLAEIVEDDNHMICNVGQSQRILLCLEGYIEGINIYGHGGLRGNNGGIQPNTREFAARCNEVLTDYIEGLDDAHPLYKVLIEGGLYPNINTATLRGLLDNIRQNWKEVATRVVARNDDTIRNAQAAIDRKFQQYYDLLDSANVDNELNNFEGDINAGIKLAFYDDASPGTLLAHVQAAVVYPMQPPIIVQQSTVQQLAAPQPPVTTGIIQIGTTIYYNGHII